jgi:hypothetical protein
MSSKQEEEKRPERRFPLSIESLEGRALLSHLVGVRPAQGYGWGGPTPTPTPSPTPAPTPTPTPTQTPTPTPPVLTPGQPAPLQHGGFASTPPPARAPWGAHRSGRALGSTASGVVKKVPSFYSFYTGPQWAELNAVKASGKFMTRTHTFVFTGTNQGPINQGPAVYVWGIDRNGNLPPGPFEGRPNVKFDALIVVNLNASMTPTAQLIDLATGSTTALDPSTIQIRGATIRVKVAASLLPSTGLAPSQYRFNYWPEEGGSVSSFAPEFTDVQVGTSGR